MRQLLYDWRRLRARPAQPARGGEVKRLIVVPPDPETLVASKGDEAMLQACCSELANSEQPLSVGVLVGTPEAAQRARSLGWRALPVWNDQLHELVDALERFQPDAMLTLGADLMEGFLPPLNAARRLVIADLLARRGVRSSVLGFSIERRPPRQLVSLFDAIGASVNLNIRDAISHARFSAVSSAPARLVADVAFLLRPDSASGKVASVRDWIAQQRGAGRKVLGFNVHPMLFGRGEQAQAVPRLVANSASVLARLLQGSKLSIVLLSHDSRSGDGDDECLRPLHAALRGLDEERVLYPSQQLSAAECKAIVGELDGVFTGRLHLAIAALGMGVPIAGVAERARFKGLFEHFGLNERFILSSSDALRPQPLATALEAFLGDLAQLRQQVGERLPGVRGAARQNLLGLN